MPQVVGALLAGLILGPAMLNIIQETEFIKQTAELGVIALMFAAGLETDIKEMKKTGKASIIIALFGVIIPLLGGLAVAALLNTKEFAVRNTYDFTKYFCRDYFNSYLCKYYCRNTKGDG